MCPIYTRRTAPSLSAGTSSARLGSLRGELWGETIPAIELWKQMLRMLFETGHPWITFKDPCNVRSPQDHAGVVHSSNLCTEITLNTGVDESAVCNLGSVIIDRHLTPEGEIDHERLRETVRVAVRALDCVIDVTFYPTEPTRTANSRHRPIGLGVMGLQYALYRRGIAFGSEEAADFSDEMMEAVAYYAYEASSDLAAERGVYSSYAGSKWDRGLLPPDTVDLLESERGVPVEVPRGGLMDWEPLRAKIAAAGDAQLQRAGDRADGDDLKHHGHLALYRAALQEPVRQVEHLRGLRRAEPVHGSRLEGRRPVEPGAGRGDQAPRRRHQRDRRPFLRISASGTEPRSRSTAPI